MRLLPKLFSDRGAREKWDAGLVWFRLRYLDANGPTKCINLLSRPQACGRAALYYRPGEAVSALYLGLPERHVRLLKRMVADFGFSLAPMLPETEIPPAQRLTSAKALPWDKPFLAHVINESVFLSLLDAGSTNRGRYLPQSPALESGNNRPEWRLPDIPPTGLTLQPYWNGHQPPSAVVATEPDSRRWPLGCTHAGVPLHAAGRINIYGRQEAIATWLVQQITQMIAVDHAGLVIIDGAGDLVPKLKRKSAVTRLLGEQLAYVDIDGAALRDGFNPLAVAPGERGMATLQRWQRWFQGMNVHPHGVALLERAWQDGVGDIPSLRKWLKKPERQGQHAAVASLAMALNRLTSSRLLREWLEWPTNRFAMLPEGALFFACQATGWDRQQLLRAAILGTTHVEGLRLIIHGFPWQKSDDQEVADHPWLITSNGPLLADSTVVLVESRPEGVDMLSRRFLNNDAVMTENLQLLRRGESIIIDGDEIVFTSW